MGMGERIKERRLAMHFTQEELAQKLGLQKSAIAKYENGRVENIKRSVIARMSEILECSPSYLMGLEESAPSKKDNILSKYDIDTLTQLNDYNIDRVNTYAKNLLNVQKIEEPVLMAAHHDNPTPEEQEKMLRDLNSLKRPTK